MPENKDPSTERDSPSTMSSMFRKLFDSKASEQPTQARQHTRQGGLLPTISPEARSPSPDGSTTSPLSVDFDSISSLPTPVVSEAPSALLPGFAPQRTPSGSRKKNYGALSTRPSSINGSSTLVSPVNRHISEYGSMNSIDRFSNAASKTTLNTRLNGTLRSPQKRTVSTPFQEEPEQSEREEPAATATKEQPNDILYPGVDNAGNRHVWRQRKQLGTGSFSTVVMGESLDRTVPFELRQVAIKVIELPVSSETRTRVESSLRRELDVLKALDHPSIIRILALSSAEDKYCIITPLCEGGDLFELAAKHRDNLKPSTIRRIFAETACAISYLHHHNIVHRDIKLENILVNIPFDRLVYKDQFGTTPIVTVTDFGLSRTIDPENPLLTTRCGSEDYVPPELLIGLPYDGRESDSWALGVLLYAIMESRLPFDPPPTKSIRARSRVAHRIARIEWAWAIFDDDNKGETWRGKDWDEAKWIVENLLVRREKRITTKQVCETKWVSESLPESFKRV